MINIIDIEIWGRCFSLEVEYDCYAGESVTKKQIKAFENFRQHPEWIEKAKMYVEDFFKTNVESDDENQKKDNIFSYIKPIGIFVKRDEEKSRIAIMCKYRYDQEHGLAIVFDKQGKVTVGLQDIIL